MREATFDSHDFAGERDFDGLLEGCFVRGSGGDAEASIKIAAVGVE